MLAELGNRGLAVLASLTPLAGVADCDLELDRTMSCEGDGAVPIELLHLLFAFGGLYFLWSRYDGWSRKRAERKRREREDDPSLGGGSE